MLYEVSFSLTFGSRDVALAIWNTAMASQTSAANTPDERPPAILAKPDGAFTVSAVMRFANAQDQSRLVEVLQSAKGSSQRSSPGHICAHTCLHDEGKACRGLVTDRWAGGDT